MERCTFNSNTSLYFSSLQMAVLFLYFLCTIHTSLASKLSLHGCLWHLRCVLQLQQMVKRGRSQKIKRGFLLYFLS